MSLAVLFPPSVLLVAPQDPVQAPADDGTGWRLERLDVEVVVLPEEGRLETYGTMRLVLEDERSRGPTIAIDDDDDVMRFARVEAPEGATVELDRHPERASVHLARVRFPHELERGSEVELAFEALGERRGSQLLVEERIAIASWTDAWHPFPLPRPGESISGKMRTVGTTTLHLPAGWSGVCNGVRAEREESGEGVRELWELEDPVARSFAAGPFRVDAREVGERTVTVCRTSPGADGPDASALAAAAALEAMEARLGPYPYRDFYIVEVPADLVTWYGASQQGMIFATSGAFGYEDGNLALFAHEMGHGWWGNLVGTEGPGALLCSETLAQLGVVIALEAIEGDDAATEFLRFSRRGYSPFQCARGFFGMWRAGNARPLAELDGSTSFDHDLSDAKGHWVYAMLRRRIGDELFFATLRGLIEEFANRDMTLDDVRAAFVSAAPAEAELETFFEQWLERTGAPILELEWSEEAGRGVEVVLRQAQAEDPYHLWVEVDSVDGSGTRTHRIELRERETRAVLEGVAGATDVRLDPRQRILRWTPEYGERPE